MLEKYHYQIFSGCSVLALLLVLFFSFESRDKRVHTQKTKDLQIIQKDISTTVWKEGENASITTIKEKDSLSNISKQSRESSSWTTIKWKKSP